MPATIKARLSQTAGRDRLAKKHDAQKRRANGTDAHPDGVRRANGQRLHGDAEKTQADDHREHGADTRPQAGEAFGVS